MKALIGKHGFVEYSKMAEYKVKKAIVRNRNKEIVIDYEYESPNERCTLKSEDGIHFRGKYEATLGKIGDCEFTLYENKDGEYLLFGGYSEPESRGIWWFELKPNLTK